MNNRYEILKKHINTVSLVSLTSQNWYDQDGNLVPWTSGSLYIGPETGDTVYNINVEGSLEDAYYNWNGLTWVSSSKEDVHPSYNIPLFLNSTVDEMGVMVGFDGNIEQVEQLCNFSYTQTGSTIQIYNTVNPDKLRKIVEQTYTINWGDGGTSGLTVNDGVIGNNLPTISHTYSISGGYTISITLDAPWITQKLNKKVTIPQDITQDLIGTFIYTGTSLPYYNTSPTEYYLESGRTQNYLNDFEYNPSTGYTNNAYNNVFGNYTGFTYLGIGGSRLEEKRQYGSTSYSDTTTGTTTVGDEILNYTGYSFTYTGNTTGTTVVHYRDYEDGTTLITGNTTGFTQEEVINQMITRNEHFLGFVDDPTIYSDIFVERGKQGVLEKTLRLGEIDNIGELDVYGNGYFKIRKQ
jgi:hypothetical protein